MSKDKSSTLERAKKLGRHERTILMCMLESAGTGYVYFFRQWLSTRGIDRTASTLHRAVEKLVQLGYAEYIQQKNPVDVPLSEFVPINTRTKSFRLTRIGNDFAEKLAILLREAAKDLAQKSAIEIAESLHL